VEKITGLKETVKGKVTHNPELAAKGHDRMTGVLKHKELEEDAVSFLVYQPSKYVTELWNYRKPTHSLIRRRRRRSLRALTPPQLLPTPPRRRPRRVTRPPWAARAPRPTYRSNIINPSTYYSSTLVQRNNFVEYHPVLSEVSASRKVACEIGALL
jgi:hypothetical protein